MTVQIITADVMDGLAGLPDGSVNCCVTSPPYWGLRDYGVDGQIGLEDTPEAFIARLVDVFREVRRVLADDGTCWVNLGDSYSRNPSKGGSGPNGKHDAIPDYGSARSIMSERLGSSDGKVGRADRAAVRNGGAGLKEKDLVGIPWMFAFAARADGWYLRQDIIWSKPNPMPESVTDRCTKAHEYVFLLTKSARYFYDAEAIKDRAIYGGDIKVMGDKSLSKGQSAGANVTKSGNATKDTVTVAELRNKRSVWTVPSKPFSEAHFATFPPALIEPMIKAGCPVGGTVLDPFGGAGTTGLVADRLQRHAILIEINPEYAAIADSRINGDRGGLLDAMEAAE